MFFSPEILAQRESGFGLLWLAATLGAKSSFKKLPKKALMSADVAKLCDLIAQPDEPLALRLSSNLMVGAARVYKAKQELFYTDVSSCVTLLKKVVQEIHSAAQVEAQLQMAQTSVKPSAITLNSENALMDFDDLVVDWGDILDDNAADDYKPKSKHAKKKKSAAIVETGRAQPDLHILVENHDFFGSSFDQPFGTQVPASSQEDNEGFDFGDQLGDVDIDIGIGDLGQDWGLPPSSQGRSENADMDVDVPVPVFDNIDMGGLDDLPSFDFPHNDEPFSNSPAKSRKQTPNKENTPYVDLDHDKIPSPGPKEDSNVAPPKKKKKCLLHVDTRTELSNDEMKAMRQSYAEAQDSLRRNILQKNLAKDATKFLEELMWGIPVGLQQAPALANLWRNSYKLQYEAMFSTNLPEEGEPKKRRRVKDSPPPPAPAVEEINIDNWDIDLGDMNMGDDQDIPQDMFENELRSSEDPGQGRNASRPPSSLAGRFEMPGDVPRESQSSVFPWDDAGVSSSPDGPMRGSGQVSIERGSLRLHGSSHHGSRRGSSVGPLSALAGDLQLSPAMKDVSLDGEDYVFDVPASGNYPQEEDSQRSDNLVTLEKNSYNFLEYARMQLQSQPQGSALFFDDIVSRPSTHRVAASAFYHCLVLCTKALIRIEQPEPYGPIGLCINA